MNGRLRAAHLQLDGTGPGAVVRRPDAQHGAAQPQGSDGEWGGFEYLLQSEMIHVPGQGTRSACAARFTWTRNKECLRRKIYLVSLTKS